VILIVDSFEVALVTMIASGIELVFVAFIAVYRGLALQSVGDIVLVTSIVVGNIVVISIVLDMKTMNSLAGQWI
jgi:hypothetical protein